MHFEDDICGIYRFKNKINGKCYVGQSIHIKERYLQHTKAMEDEESTCVIYLALRKYGLKSFDFEILEECDRSLLNEREIYWISYYDSFHSGYNMTPGGQGGAWGIPVDQYDYEGNYIASYDSIKQAQDATGASNIARVCKGNKFTSGGYQWFLKGQGYSRNLNDYALLGKRKVQQYDLKGNFIKEYNSLAEAANFLHVVHSSITRACNEEVQQVSGFQFKYSDDEFREIKSIKEVFHYYKRKVAQYDKDGNYLNCYESILDAERHLGLKEKSSNITNVCKGKSYESNGFQWRYVEDGIDYTQNIGKSILKEKYQEGAKYALTQRHIETKKILQCDKDNHDIIINHFNSITEANSVTNIDKSNIGMVCKGKRKSAGGFFWKYDN